MAINDHRLTIDKYNNTVSYRLKSSLFSKKIVDSVSVFGYFCIDCRCVVLWCDTLCHANWCISIWRTRRS